jgi:hypothetical protein
MHLLEFYLKQISMFRYMSCSLAGAWSLRRRARIPYPIPIQVTAVMVEKESALAES